MNRLPIYILHSDTNGAATYLDSLAVKIARFSGRTPLLSLEIHPPESPSAAREAPPKAKAEIPSGAEEDAATENPEIADAPVTDAPPEQDAAIPLTPEPVDDTPPSLAELSIPRRLGASFYSLPLPAAPPPPPAGLGKKIATETLSRVTGLFKSKKAAPAPAQAIEKKTDYEAQWHKYTAGLSAFSKALAQQSPAYLILVIDDELLTAPPESQTPEAQNGLFQLFQAVLRAYPSPDDLQMLHLVFRSPQPGLARRKQIAALDLLAPSHGLRLQRALRDVGLNNLKAFDPRIHQLLFEKLPFAKISCSFVFSEAEPEEGGLRDRFWQAALGLLLPLGQTLRKPDSFFQAYLSALDRIFHKLDYRTDLQITVLGQELKTDIYRAIVRTVAERWNIRYEHLQVEQVSGEFTGKHHESTLIKISPQTRPEAATSVHVALVADNPDREQLDRFQIGAARLNARQDIFIWVLPSEWFGAAYDEDLLTSPLHQQLITLNLVIDALKGARQAQPPVLHIFETVERDSVYGVRPWPLFTPADDPIARRAVERRAPRLYHLIQATLAEVRFHTMPWSTLGSHLDYAPRWIDQLLRDALHWDDWLEREDAV